MQHVIDFKEGGETDQVLMMVQLDPLRWDSKGRLASKTFDLKQSFN